MPKPRSTRFRNEYNRATSRRCDSLNPTGPDILEQDISNLKRIAENPAVQESTRAEARDAVETFQTVRAQTLLDLQLAEQWGVRGQVAQWSDQELAEYVADGIGALPKNRESRLARRVHKDLAAFCWHYGWLPKMGFERLFDLVLRMFAVAICDELGDRSDRKESPDGREVATLIVEERRRAELLKKLGNKASRRLWFPGEYPGQSEEGPALAREKIWESVSDFVAIEPPAANPEVLLAFMRGGLNRVLGSARDHVRTQIETEHRRSARMVFSDHVFPTRKGEEETDAECLTEQLPDAPRGDPDSKLLVEQLRSKGQLTDQELKLIEFVKVEGHTQKEAAAKFGISQSTVSKFLQEAKEKLA